MSARWHRAAGDPLDQQARQFANEMHDLLQATLPDAPTVFARRPDQPSARPIWVVAPFDESANKPSKVPLLVNGEHLADLGVWLRCRMDTQNRWLAVDASKFELSSAIDREPLVRVEYRRDAHSEPCSHAQLHAERGAFTHLLTRAERPNPHALDSLRLPLGGARFRPCLEDFIEFCVEQCGVESVSGWQGVVQAGRERWRRTQLAAAVRDCAEEAVQALRQLDYTVVPPPDGPVPARVDKLRLP
jgi:hypothetical protein